jgi:hypothetical protein
MYDKKSKGGGGKSDKEKSMCGHYAPMGKLEVQSSNTTADPVSKYRKLGVKKPKKSKVGDPKTYKV